MPHILLLGAGFSRNWGGWLADDVFEYLVGCFQADTAIRDLLWSRKEGGFEEALAQLQADFAQRPNGATEANLKRFESAILQMFGDMDDAFSRIAFEFQNKVQYLIRSCFVRFDAIFTLNQDLLMERHYLNGNVALSSYRSWNSWQIPGMQQLPSDAPSEIPRYSPEHPSKFVVHRSRQPFFKLHGSTNWIDTIKRQRVLVIGGNEPSTIRQHRILEWNHEQCKTYLSKPETRLMVIGYSFSDEHINRAISEAVDRGTLRLFIINPVGVDVLDRRRRPLPPIPLPDPFFEKLQPYVIGAPKRSLKEIFGGDLVEHGKVMRFFD